MRSPRRPLRLVLVLVPACLVLMGGCGVAVGWGLGFFNADGRFHEIDACQIMPGPATLAPLVRDGRREPRGAPPEPLFGEFDDTTRSECKWSSVPQGVDRPFRTVRILAVTEVASSDRSGPDEAAKQLRIWYDNRVARPQEVTPVDVGEGGYRTTDQARYRLLVANFEVYDVHARFRISNVLVDVSARTHDKPGTREKAQVVGLAREVAAILETKG